MTPDDFTALRTEHGNVIALDRRDNQEFVLAECHSPDVAAFILDAVRFHTARTRSLPHEKNH
ncbi:TraS protein [Salmonella enterica]|uniref:TraS protein n=1 Tax=Salmonella enterica I TaxID=59201 RepID=A0A3R1B5G3_SALET|nr:TraS protein [Salmonella enterica]EHL5833442.1 TraS protein [Salmonella enterica]EHX2188053.1 TraS protein [Salmonella enterica subsp. enterica serovar Kedougou]MML54660.1 TraS protein [Salmonella enterica subsp. enterica serovar Kidderminster]